jgi:hypothetical protein
MRAVAEDVRANDLDDRSLTPSVSRARADV